MKVKHWAPITSVIKYVESLVKDGASVLEIGPGHVPFSKATTVVDRFPIDENDTKTTVVDVNRQSLPFKDKSFDFVYARHIVEDLYNPDLLLNEMNRVGKAGYIETPSAAVELCRDVDGGRNRPHRGYIHHRNIVWTENGQLFLAEKATIIEHLILPDNSRLLEQSPILWNMYFQWKDSFSFTHLEHDIHFDLHSDTYKHMLLKAMYSSIEEGMKMEQLICGVE
jgi:ubiquinone/menaquinone biosynthesis C-methylase UbiE